MTGHDPRAAALAVIAWTLRPLIAGNQDIPDEAINGACARFAPRIVRDLAAAGLAVVAVDSVPPWMRPLDERDAFDCPPGHVGWFCGESQELEWLSDHDHHGAYADRLYVRKETKP